MRAQIRIAIALFTVLSIFSSVNAQSPLVKLQLGKGLQIMAADSSMSMKMSFRMQSLFETERDLNSDSEWATSFLVRRSRLKFDGFAFHPSLIYKVELALSNRDLSTSSDLSQTSGAPKIILDAAIKWAINDHFELWAGQTQLPGNRERVVSSQNMQLVDRSRVNSLFNIDRDMGLQLYSSFKAGNMVIKPIIAWALGEGRNLSIDNEGGFEYVGRLEFLPLGEFTGKGDYTQTDFAREVKPKASFGATYSFNEGTPRQSATGRFLIDSTGSYFHHDLKTILVDGIFKYRGFSLLSEYAYRTVTDMDIPDEPADYPVELIDDNNRTYTTGYGIMVQSGYLFKNNWEVACRYTYVKPDAGQSFNETTEYTLGVSKYFVGNSLKIQSDISLSESPGMSDPNLKYRLQMELAF
ncbi:MAG: FmdC precursor [Saprospiraceae bacterium]|nr:FmdC precursor [Saprospiraceae bacterium]